jgi:hypothetical protein
MGRGEKDSESWITAAETERSLGFPRDAPFVGWSLFRVGPGVVQAGNDRVPRRQLL